MRDLRVNEYTPFCNGPGNYAASYHAAADLIFEHGLTATHPEAPASFVYYQAIELYLKAFLRLRGVSASRLRGIGHDPQRLRKRSIERGLSFGEIENNVLNWFISTEAWTDHDIWRWEAQLICQGR